MNKLVFDIGGSNTKYALMTAAGELLHKDSFPTDFSRAEAFLTALTRVAEKYTPEIDEIALSTNGRLHPDGHTYRAYTAECLRDMNLRNEMQRRTGLPVVVLEDGACAALGEWWKGGGQGCESLLVLVLGTGLGGGLILNGKLHMGARRNAAMVFGMLDCDTSEGLRTSAMGTTFGYSLYLLAAQKGLPAGGITGPEFFAMAQAGDVAAQHLLKQYCASTAAVLYNACMMLDPAKVILTGGLSQQTMLVEGINQELQRIADTLCSNPLSGASQSPQDLQDYRFTALQGSLGSDANLYGALYHLLHRDTIA